MPNTFSNQILHAVALSLLKNVGSITARKLIAHLGDPESVFSASAKILHQITGVGPYLISELRNKNYLLEAEAILSICENQEIQIALFQNEDYPQRLKHLYDAPLLLYVKGNGNLNADRFLGLVGTRKATEYGRWVCQQIATESRAANIHFISGLAFGIDAAIHQSCVENDISNFAVLAGGFQYIYPYQHRKLAEQLLEKGGWVSEHPPHVKPDPRFFPMRNRIIAGLSDALIVVEAANRGGALITADFSNNYNREVFAVPGMINKPYSEGCNQLIAENKAIIYRSLPAVLDQMKWNYNTQKKQQELIFDYSRFTLNESSILAALHQLGELSIEELSWKTAIPLKEIALITINLEFNGMIRAMAGNRYQLV